MSDLISKQAAIDAIEVLCQEHRYKIPGEFDTYSQYNEAWQDALDRAEGAIGILPSAQPEQRWIPCSSGNLPQTTDPVNITWVNRDPPSYCSHIKDVPFTATGHYHNGKWWWYSATCQDYLDEYGESEVDRVDDRIEILAWQPLPEPYQQI